MKISCHYTLELLGTSMQNTDDKPTLSNVVDFLKSLSLAQRAAMSEVCTLAKPILVSPATNAVSERSISGLRRIKNYLRSTMSQQRLNNLMVLHVYKERTNELCLKSCLNKFVIGSEHRTTTIGHF